MNDVVKNLMLYAPVYQEGKWKDASAYGNSPVKIEAKNPDSLIETEKIYFEWRAAPASVIIDRKIYYTDQWVKTQFGELKFNSTGRVSKEEGNFYFSLVNHKNITLGLLANLSMPRK